MSSKWVAAVLVAVAAIAVAAGLLTSAGCGKTAKPVAPDPNKGNTEEEKGPPLFREITAASGVNFSYRNGEEAGHLAILESLGGGVGVLDFDHDGRPDLVITGGGYYDRTAEQFKKEPSRKPNILGLPCKLYRNLGGNKFEDVSAKLKIDGKWFYSHGVAVGDFNRDGWPDLLITGWGRMLLLRNDPVDPKDPSKGRQFVDVTKKSGLTCTWSTSAAWADFDGDGYPDLYVCQYGDWSFANHPSCSYDGKTPDVCPPKNFSGLQHLIFRNNGDGTFTNVTAEVGLVKGTMESSKGLGVVAVDVNGDGRPDIYVANDTVDKFLYINECSKGKFRFREVGMMSGAARDDRGSPNGSMGMGVADYNDVGRPSLWVTNYENEKHGLYLNRCKPGNLLVTGPALIGQVGNPLGHGLLLGLPSYKFARPEHVFFSYQTTASGIAAIGQKWVGWGTGFLDVDHHGWEDLFISNGHAIRYPTGQGVTRLQRPLLMRNQGGRFRDISKRGGPYFQSEHLARGVALVDLDKDGRVDLVISHMNAPVAILRNEAPTDGNHWLGVELLGKDHADVVGAKVTLEVGQRKMYRFAVGGNSYASSSDRRLVFGLGKEAKVGRLTVRWPDRTEQHWDNLKVDEYHPLRQGK